MSSTDVTRLFDFPYYQLEKYNLPKAFTTKYNGKWESISSQEYVDKANTISRGLLRLGVKPNDKIAIISSNNRTEWNVCDIGILQLGAQNIPIYPTVSKEDYEYILNHSEAIYCFVSDQKILDKLNQIKHNTKLKEVFTFEDIQGEKSWNEVLKLGDDKSNQQVVEQLKSQVKPEDLATIIYTSGTTGRPKGVMLSHKNILSNAISSEKRVPLESGNGRALSFLPVCHIFERMLLYLYQYCGLQIYFAESIDKLSENAQEVKPNVMTAVPRLYEKIYDKILAKGSDLKGIKRFFFLWSIDLGLKYEPYEANGWFYEFKLKIARKLIFKRWQEALGGELNIMVSGSAALQPRLVRMFTAAGMPIMEGYGLTETSPVISVNDIRNKGFKIGSVGKILENLEVKISNEDEILVKGPSVMMGYYKDPEKTMSVFENGYFKTGDKGKIDDEGFLKITGRIKEMFKTSGGKYVIPTLLEDNLKQSRFIENIMVVGEGEKMPTALIEPNFEFIRGWIDRKELNIGKSNKEISSSKDVISRIQREVDECNKNFGKWEQIKRFTLIPERWTEEKGHLTPTMKMKRKEILAIYKKEYDKMYDRC